MAEPTMLDKVRAKLGLDGGKHVQEMTSTNDYSHKNVRRNNNVKRSQIPTYVGSPNGQGAAKNAADAIKNRKKMLDEL